MPLWFSNIFIFATSVAIKELPITCVLCNLAFREMVSNDCCKSLQLEDLTWAHASPSDIEVQCIYFCNSNSTSLHLILSTFGFDLIFYIHSRVSKHEFLIKMS